MATLCVSETWSTATETCTYVSKTCLCASETCPCASETCLCVSETCPCASKTCFFVSETYLCASKTCLCVLETWPFASITLPYFYNNKGMIKLTRRHPNQKNFVMIYAANYVYFSCINPTVDRINAFNVSWSMSVSFFTYIQALPILYFPRVFNNSS